MELPDPLAREHKRQVFALTHPGLWTVIFRAICWGLAALRCALQVLGDWFRGRRSSRDRARRLRGMFESLGASAIKFGQQMSNRIDLLPVEVCDELALMLDRVPKFSIDHAIERIEAATGMRLSELFSTFDPEPIGSASIACVYQGILRTGERVAVKVRRPGAIRSFSADLIGLEWLLALGEFSTLLRPGWSKALGHELQSMVMEELDFPTEARYCTLFRRLIRRDRIRYASAPKVFHDYSSDDVIFFEFVEGVSMGQVLTARESGDRKALETLTSMNIHPETVGRRLQHLGWWGIFECPFFHADPHPANIIVQPNNHLVFIDFGACAATSDENRRLQAQLYQALLAEDAQTVTDLTIQTLVPLPYIDMDLFRSTTEKIMWERLLVFRDKDAPWYERTTASLWLSFLEVSRDFRLPIGFDTIRMMRSSLLYDTLVCRLWPGARLTDHRSYLRKQSRRVRRRARRKVGRSRTLRSIAHRTLDARGVLDRAAFSLQTALRGQEVDFLAQAGKKSYVALVLLKFIAGLGFLTLGLAGVLLLIESWRGTLEVTDFGSAFALLHYSQTYHVLVLVYFVMSARRLLFRLREAHDGD